MFAPKTRVLMEDGTTKRIKDIKVGDKLYDHSTVTELLSKKFTGKLVAIHYGEWRKLTVAGTHWGRFFIRRHRKFLGDFGKKPFQQFISGFPVEFCRLKNNELQKIRVRLSEVQKKYVENYKVYSFLTDGNNMAILNRFYQPLLNDSILKRRNLL